MTTYSGTLTGTGNFSGLGGTAVFTEKDVETEKITIAASGDYTGTLQQNITLTATITVGGLTTTQTVTKQSTSPVSGNVNQPASEPQTLFGQTVTYTSNFTNNNSEIVTNFSQPVNFKGFTGTWTFGGTLTAIAGRTLLEQGDNLSVPGFTLPGMGSLAITFNDTGTNGLTLDFLVLKGTTPVSIDSTGAAGGFNVLPQLVETNNNPTKVTITGSELFHLGSQTAHANSGDGVVTDIAATASLPTKIHSSLTLINASATTGGVDIFAGATNTSGAGNFQNGESLNPNVTVTYTGLTIKGGSGTDTIENDAKQGVVTDGNGNNDRVTLDGTNAKATLGTGADDFVIVGFSSLGTNDTAGSALGDIVKFGAAAQDVLFLGVGADAGSTAGTASIGLTKVLNAAAGMDIAFFNVTASSNIADETVAVASAATLTAAENDAVKALGSAGVAYFSFQGNEYFIATNNVEKAVSSNDAIVKLVGITDIHHATNSGGLVTLHV
jgi:hypothetical protein